MLKIYLDNCCYNRPFDDLKQEKINLESEAVKSIINEYCNNKIKIYTSDVLLLEINNIKDVLKRQKILEVYKKLNLENISFSSEIIKRAYEIREYNIKNMNSLHIAIAESSNIDYFITTDKLLINSSKRGNLKVKVINPIEFVMGVI